MFLPLLNLYHSMERIIYIFICAWLLVLSACRNKSLFEQVSASHSGIEFSNTIIENDTINPLKEVNIYNGGGVGAGDFNNDGLVDLYFTGNMVRNELYLNKGNFRFENITNTSGTGGTGSWSRGVSVVDINSDGLDDIYVSVAITKDPQKRKNILYVNQGINKDGIPVFKEMAAEYGLDDTTHTAMSYFFDYDNDGDLDVYLVVNHHLNTENQNRFRPISGDGSHPSTGRLYRNDWNETLKHPVYTNVSKEAGFKIEGYGHAALITDINNDGWKDIYVTNDFISSNILYINNRNGTFTDSTRQYFKHTSTFAMGVDIQDINNDGLQDIIELDMNPEDNFRKKMMLEANSYQTIQNFERYKYQLQYMRNTLQINQGRSLKTNDSIGNPVFSEVGFLAGTAETDWSWTPLVTDFDNDGLRDIIITNGYPKDITDHDFMIFRAKSSTVASQADILRQVPQVKLRNYAFRNKGGLQFENASFKWGFDKETFSNGGIYADLDNDGDMDVVINNINDKVSVYENKLDKEKDRNYLNIKFEGDKFNRGGFGTWISVYYNGNKQVFESNPYRGYVSSLQNMAHFGVGPATKIDSVVVIWPNHKTQVLRDINVNQVLTLKIAEANGTHDYSLPVISGSGLFTDITPNVNINFSHYEKDFIDFNIQKLLPHKFSEYSPALAAGDLDGNGLDDIVCGGTSHQPAMIFYQQPGGKFIQKELFAKPLTEPAATVEEMYAMPVGSDYKDSGILLFDADNDGDLDIYISSGGYAYQPNSSAYQDRFYLNDGKGNFKLDNTGIPSNFTSKFCVRAADYDKDGDIDLFVAGRVDPGSYPKPVSSFILRNDSKDGKVKFTDVTKEVAESLINIGLVCDAVFTDFDNDGWQDLIIAGEWMPVTFLKNENGAFKNITANSGISHLIGWWNSLAPGDFDNDGDIDYIAGNLGLNSFYKASEKYPVHITANDFDSNGSYDAIPSLFLPPTHSDTILREFPAHGRDDFVKQIIGTRKSYTNYKSFANATLNDIFSPAQLKGALRLTANSFSHALIKNEGGGKFTVTPLPVETQVSVLNGMTVNDFDGDGNLDVIINGNDYGTEVFLGRYDALNGLFLKGDGKGNFKPLSILESGIYIPGNGRALVALRGDGGRSLVAASQNNGPLKIFSLKKNLKYIPVGPGDVNALIKYKSGITQKRELYYGYSFLSQSARWLEVSDNIESVEIRDNKGKARLPNN